MAKKRFGSVQEKTRNISPVPRGRGRSKPKKRSLRSSRSPPQPQTTTPSTQSVKGDLKSIRVPSKGSTGNSHDGEKESSKRYASRSRKRNLTHQEPSESPSKKLKLDTSQVQAEEAAGKKDRSLQGSRKRGRQSQSKLSPSKSIKQESSKPQASLKQELTLEKNHVMQKSPLKLATDVNPEVNPDSQRKNKAVGKKLKLDLVTNKGEGIAAKNDGSDSSSEDSSDDEDVAWEDVDEANVADHRLEIGSDKNEASTSHKEQSPSKKGVEISITVAGGKKKKRGWTQEDFLKYVKRTINRYRKDVLTKVHKVHLLSLVAHGIFRNGLCNDQVLQAALLSHIPNDFVSVNKRKWDVAKLTNFLKWFQEEFTTTDDLKTGEKETDRQVAKVQNLSEVFVAVLRAHGHLTRLVYSMQPISVKGDLEGKPIPKTSKKKNLKESKTTTKSTPDRSFKASTLHKSHKAANNKEIKTDIKVTTPSNEQGLCSTDNKCDSGQVAEENVQKTLEKKKGKLNKSNCALKAPKGKRQIDTGDKEGIDHAAHADMKSKTKTKRPLRKRKKVDYSLSGTDGGSNADAEWIDQELSDSEENSEEKCIPREKSKAKDKTPLTRRKKSTKSDNSSQSENSSLSFVDLMDDDSDFEVTSKPLVRRRASTGSLKRKKKVMKMISSDESDESVKCLGYVSNEQDSNWWTEVYLPIEKRWICVHLESSSVNHPELCEKHATQPLVYVVAFDNKNAVKDVTNRYASTWMSKTRTLRIDSDWWEDTLHPYRSKNKKMVEMEDAHIEDQLLDKPLPTSITEYKNHPLYVLKRHLLKFEAIYPETAAILGYVRSEAVYARECVHTLHTREKWLNEALVVKQGETAYKVVKGRPKRNQPLHERDSVTIDLFGRWQTEKYKPPPAKDGKVPRNEYGNVELFLPCMLPPGTKHIQINGIQRVAKKLGIDCAQAVVGFDFHCGFSHPVIDGVVVCEEFQQVLLDAWREEEEQAEKKKAEKREKRMLANWKLLTRSLLIRERLKKRYDTEETNATEAPDNEDGEMTIDTSVSWPLNRQEGKSSVAGDGHCHVFPASGRKQDPVTGEWMKSCSCGLSLPFEKM